MAEPTPRGNWGNWLEFLFSIIGCIVGLGNVWRFPYVCYANGGAAFLIPYLLLMAVCGVPLLFLEMAVCQFSNLGPGRVWVVCPLFRGIGYSMVLIAAVSSLYYAAIIAWALYFLAMSFSNPLPWTGCDNAWNSNSCIPTHIMQLQLKDQDPGHNRTPSGLSPAVPPLSDAATVTSRNSTTAGGVYEAESSAVQFWRNHVLQDSGRSVSDLGDLRWQLMLCLLATWAVVFFSLFKDIKTSGKVVYVAAVLPYVVLLALLIRGSLLPGAVDGVIFYLVPSWHRLLDWQVWLAASSQVFFSLGLSFGGVSTLASFNRFHNNVYRDALLLPVLDAVTSVFAGFAMFVYVGYMAHVQNTTVDRVVAEGTGLAFIAYPEGVATMPLPHLWAVLFFLILFTVGLDTHFVNVQIVSSAVVDTWPRRFAHRKRWVTLTVCIVGFALGLPFVTQGGQYALKLCDWYIAAVSVMLVSVGETLVLSWIYGKSFSPSPHRSPRVWKRLASSLRPSPQWKAASPPGPADQDDDQLPTPTPMDTLTDTPCLYDSDQPSPSRTNCPVVSTPTMSSGRLLHS
ncbi:sodium-dependent proline transporter-like [Babylonia areolata]|uniref:sodium-dependent proline transporter-like n=1 Tax=Babylonia areolata TaxID=304850 RepID=UPI003FD15076